MFSHRLIFAAYSVFSANRLGSLLGFLLLFESQKWTNKIAISLAGVIFVFGIVLAFEIELDDVYVVTRVLQGSQVAEFSLAQLTSIFISSRGSIWAEALTLISDRPLMGYGIGAFSDYSEMQLGSAHSFLINYIFQFGVLIGFVITVLFFTIFYPEKQKQVYFYSVVNDDVSFGWRTDGPISRHV